MLYYFKFSTRMRQYLIHVETAQAIQIHMRTYNLHLINQQPTKQNRE